MRVAALGLGVISRYYLAAIPHVEDVELVAVCDRDPSRLRLHRSAGVACDADHRRTLARPEVDAVLVNLPNHLHGPVCTEALRAGKHVCCEKPLAVDAAEAEAMVAVAREVGRTLFCAFHRRYNANLAVALPRLRCGPGITAARARYLELIGDHVGDDAWYLDPERCGGGCLADNGPNALDALRHVLGPLEVRAATLERDAAGVDLRARVALSAGDGAIPVTVDLDWDYGEGERKDLIFELADGSVEHVDFLAGFPAFKSSLYHEYVGVLSDFRRRVAAGADRGEEGLEIARLVEDAYAAALIAPAAAAR